MIYDRRRLERLLSLLMVFICRYIPFFPTDNGNNLKKALNVIGFRQVLAPKFSSSVSLLLSNCFVTGVESNVFWMSLCIFSKELKHDAKDSWDSKL